MRLFNALSHTSASLILASLVVACGSDAGTSESMGGAGGTDSEGDEEPMGLGGDDAQAAGDAAPGMLDLELSVVGDQHTFNWTLPDDDDLDELSFVVAPASAEVPEAKDAEAIDMDAGELLLANFLTGTDYVAYFFLTDEGGNVSVSTVPFTTAGPTPVSDIFSLGLRGAVYMRWAAPAKNVETVMIREKKEGIPSGVSDGELVFEELGSQLLQPSLSNGTEYGYLFYTLDADKTASNFVFESVTTDSEHATVLDAVSECDSYGFKVGPTKRKQTFVRTTAGEDVLTGIELQLSKSGTPADHLEVQILDENEDYLWWATIPEEKIPSGINWVRISADGKGVKTVPYELLEEGKTYTIAVWTDTLDDGGSYTWKSSNNGNDCYEGGQGAGDRDFHFRTIHATSK